MNKKQIFFVVFMVLGFGSMLGFYFLEPVLEKQKYQDSSDASHIKGQIRIGVDNWVGYMPLCSRHMANLMSGAGYLLKCEDDNANYPERMKKLKRGEYEFAVATVDSYLLNGYSEDYPGIVVAVLDESKGGDALVARKSVAKSIEDFKNEKALSVAFTPDSPSSHLLKSLGVHFDVSHFRNVKGSWAKESDGSEAARKLLEDKKVDAAVLWEPDVSKALSNDDMVKILGTENTKRLIVDILLAGRKYALDHPEAVSQLLSNYFRTLKHFHSNRKELLNEIEDKNNLSEKWAQRMVNSVEWVGLYDNAAQWFGVDVPNVKSREGLIETVQSTIDILIKVDDFDDNPIPQSNPYLLQNRTFVQELMTAQLAGNFGADSGDLSTASEKIEFEKLTEEQWSRLRPIGTLKNRLINFQSGTDELSEESKAELQDVLGNLDHYPNFRLVVKGHTGLRGDKQANKLLSQGRADSVRLFLLNRSGIDPDRVRALGVGSEEPLLRLGGESERAYNYRLPRVELQLVDEVY